MAEFEQRVMLAANKALPAVVNINTADLAALESLPGIGPALAQRIVDYRQAHGSFARLRILCRCPASDREFSPRSGT
jgi:DNA uptake protein ComE-like DNA-binding protein